MEKDKGEKEQEGVESREGGEGGGGKKEEKEAEELAKRRRNEDSGKKIQTKFLEWPAWCREKHSTTLGRR